MDSSQRSFKAILIEKNTLKIIPVAYSRQNKKETRDLIEQVLNKIKYDSYKWYISGDFKIIGLLMGLQAGNTQHTRASFVNEGLEAKINVIEDW